MLFPMRKLNAGALVPSMERRMPGMRFSQPSAVHDARLDRRRAFEAEHILQLLGGGENARLAARRTGNLQADRKMFAGEAARQRKRGSACHRDRVGDEQPL